MSRKFHSTIVSAAPDAHRVLFRNFETVAETMRKLTKQRFLWAPPTDLRDSLNMHLDILWSAHVVKFSELCEALIESVNRYQFLVYGLIGRSLIEHAATMRYYVKERLQPTIDEAVQSGVVTSERIQAILVELDTFLRGSRFDWDAFLSGDFDQLSGERTESAASRQQVNAKTCIQKWARESPNMMILYDLFCDLVHPNAGSTFLVMQTWDEGVGFGGENGQRFGQEIMIRTLAGLVGIFNEIQYGLNAMLLLQIPNDEA